jgi:pimeloyl-ACP methyl ester carboxylesterase
MTAPLVPPLTVSLAHAPAPHWLDRSRYPFAPRVFQHEDGAQHFIDEGAGAPLLFVHGTPSWSFEWHASVTHLQSKYRCVAVDHLGFGLSDKPANAPYLPRHHTDRLQKLVQTLELRDVTLVVHDFGGPIALPLVAREPSRFRSVVVVNTWAWSPDNSGARRLSKFIASPLGRFLYLYCNASPRWLVPAGFADKTRLTKPTHRHLLAPFSCYRERYAPWTFGAHLTDLTAYAPELPSTLDALRTLPMSVIWGTRDRILGPEPLAHWRRAFPYSPVIELADCGHFPQLERPDAFNAALDSLI